MKLYKKIEDLIKDNKFSLDKELISKINSKIEKMLIEKIDYHTKFDNWFNKKWFFSKKKKINLEFKQLFLMYIDINYQYEKREIIDSYEGYNHQSIGGDLENIWEKPVSEKEFREKKTEWRRSGSGNKKYCDKCKKSGKTSCDKCKGQKEVKCSSCGGKSYREINSKREKCNRCKNGWVVCSKCNGKGEINCDKCDGYGEIYFYQVIVSYNKIEKEKIILTEFENVKYKWIKKIKGSHFIYEDEISAQGEDKLNTEAIRFLYEKYDFKYTPLGVASFLHKNKNKKIVILENLIKGDTNIFLSSWKIIFVLSLLISVCGGIGYYLWLINF